MGKSIMPEQINAANINCQPGIHRDWTSNSSLGYTDGQHVRFFEGRPKKIGGWRLLSSLSSLTNNNTTYSISPQTSDLFGTLEVGEVRKILTYPIGNKYIVVIAADILNSISTITDKTSSSYLVPSGLFIGETDSLFQESITFYPIRFENYLLFYKDGTITSERQGFLPNKYNWSISIYGVTSGGEGEMFTLTNPTGGGGNLGSLALVAHASYSLTDKNSPYNNYVYIATLSNLLDFSNKDNYAIDPFMSDRPLYAPMMFPLTQYPVGGVNATDPNNVFVLPTAKDKRATYCTSEVIVSGGVMPVGSFLFAFGNNGLVRNCAANNPAVWFNMSNQYYNNNPLTSNDNNIDNYKVYAIVPVRAGAGLSALAWTTNSLWLLQFTGGQGYFSYSNISNSVSCISANSIIEASGVYYWIGEDRIYSYAGAVNSVPNLHNFNWFFSNLNYEQRTKIWSFKVPHFNEIWWVFPKGSSEECNHAIIYNVTEQTWYDTPCDRTAGYYDHSYFKPILAGKTISTDINNTGAKIPIAAKGIWVHEDGLCENINGNKTAYNTYVTTCDIGLLNGGVAAGKANFQGLSNFTYIDRIFNDMYGSGNQYINVTVKQYPQESGKITATIRYNMTDNNSDYISIGTQGRLVYLTFGCDEVDSDFYLGRPVVITSIGDAQ